MRMIPEGDFDLFVNKVIELTDILEKEFLPGYTFE